MPRWCPIGHLRVDSALVPSKGTRNLSDNGGVVMLAKQRPRGRIKIRWLRSQFRLIEGSLAQRARVTTHIIWRLENDLDFNARLETLRESAGVLKVDCASLRTVAEVRS